MTTVMACGYYDPLHEGHVSNFREAAKLGDKLIVVVHQDRLCEKKKGFCHVALERRIAKLKEALLDISVEWFVAGLSRLDYEVVVAIDTDGTVAQTIRWLRPDVLAKGGDRGPNDHPIPGSEIAACAAVHCRIVYNVGEPKRPEWSSTKIALEERAALGLPPTSAPIQS